LNFSSSTISDLLNPEGFVCSCGKVHRVNLRYVDIAQGAISRLPAMLHKTGITKPFLVADLCTYEAAGRDVSEILSASHIPYAKYIFQVERPESDESAVGLAAMAYDTTCDGILAVGSGSIGDISKIIARLSGNPLITVATAPSMDGFASPTCSNVVSGLKSTVPGVCPVAIIGDLDVLCNAPTRMLQAGLGDMAAKPNALLEWRLSNLINEEFYCENVASLMRNSAYKCLSSSSGLMNRDPQAIANIMEGLVMSGIAMAFAETTRPASGIDHYFSHIWDMLALQNGKMPDLHGIQVGIGTIYSIRIYDLIKKQKPDRSRAQSCMDEFDWQKWQQSIREFLPSAADSIIRQAAAENRFDPQKHANRFQTISQRWDEIVKIIETDLPDLNQLRNQLQTAGAPISAQEIGISPEILKRTFLTTKDLRNKYMASSLLWDMGLLEAAADELF